MIAKLFIKSHSLSHFLFSIVKRLFLLATASWVCGGMLEVANIFNYYIIIIYLVTISLIYQVNILELFSFFLEVGVN